MFSMNLRKTNNSTFSITKDNNEQIKTSLAKLNDFKLFLCANACK